MLLLIPQVSFGCFGGPEAAPGSDFSVFKITAAEREELIWAEMGYIDRAPSEWSEYEQISNKYYSVKVSRGGIGSCGPESTYFYKTFLNTLGIGLVGMLFLMYAVIKYRKVYL